MTLEELLARLNAPGDAPLSTDELTALLDLLRARAEELRAADRSDENVAELQTIAQAVQQVRAEQSTRAEAAAERDRQAQEALDAIDATSDTADTDDDVDSSADGDDTAGDVADSAGDGDTAPASTQAAPLPVAAAGRPAPTAVRAPHDPRDTRRSPAAPDVPHATASLVAAGNLPGFDAGAPIPSVRALAESMSRKLRAMGERGGDALIASIRTEYPEERTLHAGQNETNEAKYQAVLAPDALVASGGICGPIEVDYTVPTFATAERPVRDALVRFGADRGGVQFVQPPTISGVAGATGIWTEATDANPSGATKAILTVACGGTTTVYVDAVVTRLQFGNMQGKFNPEQVAANTENAVAAAARIADVNLLNKIHALSTEQTLVPSVGAARGVLELVDQAIAATRYRMRLSDMARFRSILPVWFRDMIRADLAKEIANGTDRLAITNAQIDAYFTARGVTPSWHYDGVAAQGTGNTYPLQGFAAAASGALTAWPTKVAFPIFPEGSFQFLDGGELNLGVVRDSTTDATNDYETFVETFENVAFRGIESLWVVATVAPTGGSSGTVTPANP